MATYDNKILKGDQLLTFAGLVKNSIATKQDIIPANTYDEYGAADAVEDSVLIELGKVEGKIPTNISSLTNDSNYQTGTQVNASIQSAISHLSGFHFQVVETLPTTGIDTNCIYLVLKETSTEGSNVYVEWAYIQGADSVWRWEKLGDTQVNLEYLTSQEVTTIWNTAQ